jgi:superfamily I DNA/RNA helicase
MRLNPQPPHRSINLATPDFLFIVGTLAGGRSDRRAPAGPPSVKLTTLHSSKGLEFPVVFVVGLDELDCSQAKRIEELRLFGWRQLS